MSNRIQSTFDRCKSENRSTLVLYLTSGFPTPADTTRLLLALEAAGADVIELGVPFSDPIADGPVIQKASVKALEAGATVRGTLDSLAAARKAGLQAPVVLFGAYNPYLHYGLENIVRDAKAAGADGFLAADLPLEEVDEFGPIAEKAGLVNVMLVAPTTPEARLQKIAARSTGFLYCISLKGVTGARQALPSDLAEYRGRIRRASPTTLPAAVGFGVSSPDQVRELGREWDGVVIGSALIAEIERASAAGKDVAEAATAFVKPIAAVLRAGR